MTQHSDIETLKGISFAALYLEPSLEDLEQLEVALHQFLTRCSFIRIISVLLHDYIETCQALEIAWSMHETYAVP